jgi:hypothetical protein
MVHRNEYPMVNITPGICGVNSHQSTLTGLEDGCVNINGTYYYWYGGCHECIEDTLKEVRSDVHKKSRKKV